MTLATTLAAPPIVAMSAEPADRWWQTALAMSKDLDARYGTRAVPPDEADEMRLVMALAQFQRDVADTLKRRAERAPGWDGTGTPCVEFDHAPPAAVPATLQAPITGAAP